MRKLVSLAFVLVFTSGLLSTASTSQASTPQPTIISCINPSTHAQIILHPDVAACPASTFTTIWHLNQSDNSSNSGANSLKIIVCTTKNSELTYQLIRTTCPKYQTTNFYSRSVAAPITQQIIRITPLGIDGALLTLAPPAKTDAPIAYYLIKNLTTGAVTGARTTGLTSLYVYKLKPSTKYSFQIIAVSLDGLSGYVATSSAVTTAEMPKAPTLTIAPASCSAGGACAVGDTGPGGGTVFYVSTVGFNCGPTNSSTGSPTGGLCHYLEVPANTWFNGSGDPFLRWAKSGFQNIDVPGLTNIGSLDAFDTNAVTVLQNPANPGAELGAGYANTLAIVAQQGSCVLASCAYAAGAAHAYAGNSLSDWYLPNPTELNQLLAWARGETRDLTQRAGPAASYVQGGFASANYLSSSAINSDYVWYQYSSPGGGLNEGVINGAAKNDAALKLRPIRAF